MTGWRPTLELWHPKVRQAADAAAKLVAEMELGLTGRWLSLLGDSGAGKTMLARQIFEQAKRINPGNPANSPIWPPDWFEKRRPGEHSYTASRPYCMWFETSKIADDMRDGAWNLPESLTDDFCVVVDDLGASRDKTDFLADALYRIANRRLGKWTIWTANLSLEELQDRIDPRLSHRLIRDDNVVVTLDCGDYALRPQ